MSVRFLGFLQYIKFIVTFDDVEYSEEETAILYQQFFECLAKIKGVKIPECTEKAFAKTLRGNHKATKETRTSKNNTTKDF